jgi:raffinose/stachyose/melibiose transport system substrate-binding protein
MHRSWTRGFAVLMAVSAIGACSTGTSSSSGPTTLTVTAWKGGGTELAGIDQLNAAFQQAHPEYKLEYKYVSPDYETYVNTRLAGGQASDVLMADRYKMTKWFKQGYLADLSDQPWVSRMYPNLKDFNSIKGKTYQLNSENAPLGLYVNLDLLKGAGINQAPATWPEFLADLNTLKAKNMNGILLANKGGWEGITLSLELASNLVDKDWAGKYDSGQSAFNPAWGPVIDKIKALLSSGTVDSKLMLGLDPWSDGPAQFKAGKWPFFLQGAWELSDFTKNVTFNFSLNPFPGGDAGSEPKSFTFVGAGWVVNSHAKNPSGARAYLNFMSQPKNSAVFLAAESAFSTLTDVESPAISQEQPILATYKKGNTVPSAIEQLNYTDGESELGKAIQALFVNPGLSTSSVLQTLDTQIPKSPVG